jgi:hypothetical protein
MMTAVACMCIAWSLWSCRKAFLAERRLIPRQSLFSERLVLPLIVARLVWLAMLVLSLLGHLRAVGMFSVALLVCDRHLVAPHLLHFVVLCLGSPMHLHLFFVALYLFGGLQKVNQNFGRDFLDTTFGSFLDAWCGVEHVPSVPLLAYSAAASEALFGAFLFVFPTYSIGHAFGVSLHVLILLFIAGPLGPGGFHGIVGWNLFCLSWNAQRLLGDPSDLILQFDVGSAAIGAIFFAVPLLNLLTGFGERVSFKMHSQNNAIYHFVVPRVGDYGLELKYFSRLPTGYCAVKGGPDLSATHVRLHLNLLALHEAYLMPPLSVRTAASLGRNLQRVFGAPVMVFFVPLNNKTPRVQIAL